MLQCIHADIDEGLLDTITIAFDKYNSAHLELQFDLAREWFEFADDLEQQCRHIDEHKAHICRGFIPCQHQQIVYQSNQSGRFILHVAE